MTCRILLAHDQDIVRLGLRTILAPLEDACICGEAGDGIDAIRKTLQLKPDILVAGFGMPRANGLILSRRLLRRLPNQKLLLFGVVESKSVVRDLIKAGVRAVVAMNDPASAFVAAVDALRRHRMFFTRFVDSLLLEKYMFPQLSIVPEASDDCLSLRQQEVLQLLAEGSSTKEVASTLGLSTKTAETHRSSIMHKLQVHNVAQLIRYAVSHHMVNVPVLELPVPSVPPVETSRLTHNVRVARVAA